jgi:hypothetical protein
VRPQRALREAAQQGGEAWEAAAEDRVEAVGRFADGGAERGHAELADEEGGQRTLLVGGQVVDVALGEQGEACAVLLPVGR